MFTKTTFALAITFAAASAALAATKQHGVTPSHDVYDARGAYVGSDPDPMCDLSCDAIGSGASSNAGTHKSS